MSEELKALQLEMGKTHEQFKATHTKMEEEIKESGDARAQTKEAMDKLNAKLDEIQTAMKRPAAIMGPDGKEISGELAEKKAIFYKMLRRGKEALTPEERKTLIVSDDTLGGFLAMPEMLGEIDKDIIEMSPVRSVARIRNTSNRSVLVPRRTGTFAAAWEGENVQQSETEGLTYGMEEIHAHPLRALVQISMEDLEDPVFDLEAELRAEMAEQFGVAEGAAFVTGDGVKKPQGLLESGLTSITSSVTNSVGQDDILDLMYENIKSAYWPNFTYAMHRKTIGVVRKLKDNDNQYLWRPGLEAGQPPSLNGRPIVEMTDIEQTGSSGQKVIVAGDFRRGYLIVDRIAMAILRDPFTLADRAAVRFVARKRVGGQVIRKEALNILTTDT